MDGPSTSNPITERNRRAWETGRFDLWVSFLGPPAKVAASMKSDPDIRALRRLLPYLGEVVGRRIVNLQGSHGRLAVALSLKGADVTVIDFSEPNRRYALALADAADAQIDYRLADVMSAAALGLSPFDAVVMELGILHYHQDIAAFFGICASLTRPGGRMVLNEFHPVQRKLMSPSATGDYFADALVEGPAPAPPGYPPPGETCAYRFWTLGEIFHAALASGWRIDRFDEHPDTDNPLIPGTFTLVATRRPEA